MRKFILIYLLFLSALVGCGPQNLVSGLVSSKDWTKQTEASKRADAILKKMREENICNQTEGEIAIEGVGVMQAEGKFSHDKRIEIVRNSKKNMKADSTVRTQGPEGSLKLVPMGSAGFMGEQDKKILNEAADMKQGTYVNVGCQSLKSELIAGLTETKIDFYSGEVSAQRNLKVKKAFICNSEPGITKGAFAIFADEIYLNRAVLAAVSNAGILALVSNKLVLEGQSEIIAMSPMKKTQEAQPAAGINIYVGKEIQGDGKLALDSSAGNCIHEMFVKTLNKKLQSEKR